MLSAWNLKDLRIPPQTCQIQDSIQGLNGAVVTCMHTPQFLTNEPENHDFLFVGLSNGNIYTYTISANRISQLVIRFKLMFPDKSSAGDVVTDMKVDPQHMHRLLIAYENTAVVVYSLNKNRDIQRIVFSQYDQDRGKALSVNFITPECQMFVVGYSSGQLCLYKKKMTFKIQDPKEDAKYDVFGNNIVDYIKDKNRSLNIYGASTQLILSKRLKLYFFNIDSLFKEIESSPNSQVQLWDKIYSHQEEILCSQLININTQKELQQISCFVEFRNIYIKRQLQQVFQFDHLAQSYVNDKLKKKIPKEFDSDLEIQCSLNYSEGMENFLQAPLAVYISVDKTNTLRMFGVMSEQCELICQISLKIDEEGDYVRSLYFYMKAKVIIITTRLGQNFVIASQNYSQTKILKDLEQPVAKTLIYNCKHEEYFAVGLENGDVILKHAHQILSGEELIGIQAQTDQETGRVTSLSASSDDGELLFIGYHMGFITVFDHDKKKQKTFKLDAKTSKDYKVLQIEDPPKEVEDSKNHVYYAMTTQNLYCLSKKDFSSVNFQDYKFNSNILYGFGQNNLLIYELDQQIKEKMGESIFQYQSGMFEEIRQNMIQPDMLISRPQGMSKIFKKYITIKSALDKNEKPLELLLRTNSKGRKNTEEDIVSQHNQSQTNSLVSKEESKNDSNE
eukprot:403339654